MKSIIFLVPCLLTFQIFSQKSTLTDKRKKEKVIYQTVIIGNAEWMAENLNTNRFLNGDLILEAKTDEEWLEAAANETPAWCFYNNDPLNGEKYGRLYNWYAINDPRGLAPEGWRIPTDCDVWDLIETLGPSKTDNSSENKVGQSLKSIIGWADDGNGNNNSGFNAKPSGWRVVGGGDGSSVGKMKDGDGSVGGLNYLAVWWTKSIDDSNLLCTMNGNTGFPYRFYVNNFSNAVNLLKDSKGMGCAVRAVKI